MTEDRKSLLEFTANTIAEGIHAKSAVALHFICTHNSRRSQFAQAWGHALAQEYNLPITCYSGGVEVTACNPRTVAALERAGFRIEMAENGDNPIYSASYKGGQSVVLFSKLFDHESNPTSNFISLMTCSDADENCPLIPGSMARVPLKYIDPKAADDTDREAQAYDETCTLIKTEMTIIFNRVNELI